MPFEEESFTSPDYEEQRLAPKKIVIISCEGCNTEPEYFKCIKSKLPENIKNLLEIELVEKPDQGSDPSKVLRNLESHIADKFDYKEGVDILWLVIDRESVEQRKKAIESIQPICEDKGYSIAISNPTFEFWLLMHVTDVSQYDSCTLYENDWVSAAKKRRYLDKELSNILDGGFNKKKGGFNSEIVSLEKIKNAIRQEKNFCNQLPDLLDNLGSNITPLINDFLDID